MSKWHDRAPVVLDWHEGSGLDYVPGCYAECERCGWQSRVYDESEMYGTALREASMHSCVSCDWCGAWEPRWLRWVRGSIFDKSYDLDKLFLWPGNSKAYYACEDCKPKMERCFPPGTNLPDFPQTFMRPTAQAFIRGIV